MHTSTCYVVGNREGLILEEKPGDRYPFPRADELGRDLWNPEREIADCLDLIAQAKSRCEDAFRQSEFLERATKNLMRRGEPTVGKPLEDELKSVKRKYVSDRLVEAGLERAEHWGWPNIYTYTKSIGEQIIARSGIPFTIARPACCESTMSFPFPGWNEGIGTSAPIIYLAMKGHHQIVGRDVILDFIPADVVCAGMVLTLAELLEGTAKPVYQYGASDVNPGTSERFGELIALYKRKHYQRRGKGNPFINFFQQYFEPAIVSRERFDAVGPGSIAQGARAIGAILKKAPGPVARDREADGSGARDAARQEEKIDHIIQLFVPFTLGPEGPVLLRQHARRVRSALARGSREARLASGEDRLGRLLDEPAHARHGEARHSVDGGALQEGAQAAQGARHARLARRSNGGASRARARLRSPRRGRHRANDVPRRTGSARTRRPLASPRSA